MTRVRLSAGQASGGRPPGRHSLEPTGKELRP